MDLRAVAPEVAGNSIIFDIMRRLENILFLDIETVPAVAGYELLDSRWKKLWDAKCEVLSKGEGDPAVWYERAGIYAEFGKIVCVSVGYLVRSSGDTATLALEARVVV